MEYLEPLRKKGEKLSLPYISSKKGHSNINFLATDLANQYLWYVIDHENDKGRKLALTEGIILKDNLDNTVLEACILLSNKYKELLQEYPNLEGIYTVMNAGPKLEAEAHQNWIFLNIKDQILIRMEPNGAGFDDYSNMSKLFRFKDLMNCLSKSLNIPWEYATTLNINKFSGCRATSTILALLSLMGIDYEKLRRVQPSNLLSLAIAISDSIHSQECKLPRLPRTGGRKQKGLKSFAVPAGIATGPPPDFAKMKVTELKTYLKSNNIPFASKDLKAILVQRAIASLNSIIVV